MIYTDGTIAIKAGSPVVTGTGTQWKKNIHGVAPGQLISIENGTAPVSMMIRAVNSDTELVLSFNAPVTLSGAKYSIATTVPDTISDAARTMSANQGYIVYFLQAMQQWMTDTGQVEIEFPNGQKITLESLKALNEISGKIPKVVQDTGDSKTNVMSQEATTNAIKTAKPGDATTTEKGVVQLSASIGISTTKVPHEKAVKDFVNKLIELDATGTETRIWNPTKTNYFPMTNGGYSGSYNVKKNMWDWCWNPDTNNFTIMGGVDAKTEHNYNALTLRKGDGFAVRMYTHPHAGDPDMVSFGYLTPQNTYQHSITLPYGNGAIAVIGTNVWVDGSGYIKKSSPIIQIHPDGTFDTNDESEGAEVCRTGTGQYHITGILGYNSDGAWGVNGGISVPKDNNGLELVYVDDRVQEDGSLIIETCHRQHAHLPDRFQNWRLKEITPEGERIFYQDGEPCDLPESTRLDVRVEMPQGSVWNVKQRELAEQMECEQAEREAAEKAGE